MKPVGATRDHVISIYGTVHVNYRALRITRVCWVTGIHIESVSKSIICTEDLDVLRAKKILVREKGLNSKPKSKDQKTNEKLLVVIVHV